MSLIEELELAEEAIRQIDGHNTTDRCFWIARGFDVGTLIDAFRDRRPDLLAELESKMQEIKGEIKERK